MRADSCGAFGAVAQLGERGLCKPEVVGSNPISSTIQWLLSDLTITACLFWDLSETFVGLKGATGRRNAVCILMVLNHSSSSGQPGTGWDRVTRSSGH